MDYKQILATLEESKHFISMVSAERVIELGYNLGLDENSTVLDLCCGFGETLKLWSEAFGISGVGVDRVAEFIEQGKTRLTSERVNLIVGDVLEYRDEHKYDIVMCTENLWNIGGSINFLERFVKPGGKLVFGRLYSKIPAPPKELTDFDGELQTLGDIYETVKNCGYYITAMASDTTAEWERYITWSAKRDLEQLRQERDNSELASWIDKWYRIYFDYRRPYEGWAMFGIEKL
jgi:ubiquinone/menaquinone biosynthesis C-methylase UbiE